jgi:hypothetical protein
LTAFSRYEGRATDSLFHTVLGNAGNIVVLKAGVLDAEYLAPELGVAKDAITRIAQYEGIARVVANGTETDSFSLRIPNADEDTGDPSIESSTAQQMITQGRWVDREMLEANYEAAVALISDSEWLQQRQVEDLRTALSAVPGVGSRTIEKILEIARTKQDLCQFRAQDLTEKVPGLRAAVAASILAAVCTSPS